MWLHILSPARSSPTIRQSEAGSCGGRRARNGSQVLEDKLCCMWMHAYGYESKTNPATGAISF